MKAKIFLLQLAVLFFGWVLVWAQVPAGEPAVAPEDTDFVAPPDAVQTEAKTITLGKITIESRTYECPDGVDELKGFYQGHFSDTGYQTAVDLEQKESRVLRFEKGATNVSVSLAPKADASRINIMRYVKQPGAKVPAFQDMDWKDWMQFVPKEDTPGADLDIVPRPPQSVRLTSQAVDNIAGLTYIIDMSVEELRLVYLEAMEEIGWVLDKQYDLEKDMAKAREMGLNLSQIDADAVLFKGLTLGDMLKGQQVLHFYGEKGSAEINLMNSEPGKVDPRVLVTINYIEGKDIYEAATKK